MDYDLHKWPGLMEFCNQLYEDRYRSPYLIACMVDAYEEMLEQQCEEKDSILNKALKVIFIPQVPFRSRGIKYLVDLSVRLFLCPSCILFPVHCSAVYFRNGNTLNSSNSFH